MLMLPLVLAFPSVARAQSDEPAPRVVIPAVQEVDMEGFSVTARMLGPDGRPVFEVKRQSFQPLIHLRTDFRGEMDESVDQVR